MPRVNVYVPDELARAIAEQLPDLSPATVLQDGLRAALCCRHERLVCARCAAPVDAGGATLATIEHLGRTLLVRLEEHLHRDGTVEGAGRVVRDVLTSFGATHTAPLPRMTRAARAAKLAQDRAEHPTARTPAKPVALGGVA